MESRDVGPSPEQTRSASRSLGKHSSTLFRPLRHSRARLRGAERKVGRRRRETAACFISPERRSDTKGSTGTKQPGRDIILHAIYGARAR